jgi:hypothetical protein
LGRGFLRKLMLSRGGWVVAQGFRLKIGIAASLLALVFAAGQATADEPSVPLGGVRSGLKDAPSIAVRTRVRPVRAAVAQRRLSDAPNDNWLYDFKARVNDGRLWNAIVGEPLREPQAKWRRQARRLAAQRVRAPQNAVRRVALIGTVVPVKPVVSEPVAPPPVKPVATAPVEPPKRREIETSAIQTAPEPRQTDIDEDEILERAAKSQAALDLVKLELAARTYDEQKKSGERVFVDRPDWKMLENAHDSMTDGERAAARSAGFIAHTYVNDATKTIVVAVAGSQDLQRDFLAANVWRALILSEAPQHFYFAKSYVKSVIRRYQLQGYVTECVGHSLGGGACAYAAAEIGVKAYVVNPIAVGSLAKDAKSLVTNYIVDGDVASIVYPAFGAEIAGDIQKISNGRERVRAALKDKYGVLAGPILVIRDVASSVTDHKISRALERIAVHAGVTRPR